MLTVDKARVERVPVKAPRGLMFVVLRKISHLGDNAYGAEIRKQISKQSGEDVPAAKIYIALARLEDSGLVSARDELERPAGRRGRPRRIYKLTAPGLRALQAGVKLYVNPVTSNEAIDDAEVVTS